MIIIACCLPADPGAWRQRAGTRSCGAAPTLPILYGESGLASCALLSALAPLLGRPRGQSAGNGAAQATLDCLEPRLGQREENDAGIARGASAFDQPQFGKLADPSQRRRRGYGGRNAMPPRRRRSTSMRRLIAGSLTASAPAISLLVRLLASSSSTARCFSVANVKSSSLSPTRFPHRC